MASQFRFQIITILSCGGVRSLTSSFAEAGSDCLEPLEVKSGMDLVELKRSFGGKLAFMGGIDVEIHQIYMPGFIRMIWLWWTV